MYAVFYLHRINQRNVDTFLRVLHGAATVFYHYDVVACHVYEPTNLVAKYGCTSFLETIDLASDEQLFIEINIFRNKEHHDSIMPLIDADPQINQLYDELTSIVNTRRLIRGEFTQVF